MEKKFKHKITGEIITYKDGVIKSGTFVLDMGCEPSSEYWEEVKETYPIGTKVKDEEDSVWEHLGNNNYKLFISQRIIMPFEIGEGKRFQVIEEPKKDYEILSFYAKNIEGKNEVNSQYIWYETYKGNGKWSRMGHITSPYTTEEILNNSNYDIHSVRRLSDGFIITLGDYCKAKKGSSGKVTTIEFCGNGELRIGSDKRYYVGINDVFKSEVLFISNDGIEIKEGDDCYLVYLPLKSDTKFPDVDKFRKELLPNPSYRLIFSTKEAAENFIICNKPCLSFNDIWNISDNKSSDNNYVVVSKKELKQLAKSKL